MESLHSFNKKMKNNSYIPVNEILMVGNEKKYILDCLKSNFISSSGDYVKKFELEFAKKIGCKYAISVSNGTAALQIAIEALNIKKGDEVILPSFTIISCILPLVRIGAKPVLIESNLDDWNISVDDLKKKITKNTKLLILPHLYGLCADIDKIKKILKNHNVKLLEDSAESIGLKYKGRYCGSFGDVSTFSFYANKHITTGEGGMILTNNKKVAEKCRYLINLCFNSKRRFKHYDLGYNFRMTNIQCAIGLAQLENLEYFIKKKIEIGNFYNKSLKNINQILLPLKKTNFSENIYWIYGILLKKEFKLSVEEIRKKLLKKGIETRNFFWPLHKQPILKKLNFFKNVKLQNSEYLSKNGFYIPSGLGIKETEMKYVSDCINEILK
jgi:perosamine synthetase